MTESYAAPQRQVRCRILTHLGWLEGELHLPERAFLVEYLSHAPDFVTLTDVSFPNDARTMPYLALQHRACLVVIPDEEETRIAMEKVSESESHSVLCILEDASVEGRVEVVRDNRVSDYLMHRRGFLLVEDAQVSTRDPTGAWHTTRDGAMLVNADRTVGVAELGTQATGESPAG
jgi:hypothetical protein